MNIKSLLQIILVLLIFLIIGSIYYFYFFSGSANNQKAENDLVNNIILEKGNNSDEDLQEIAVNEIKPSNNYELSVEKNISDQVSNNIDPNEDTRRIDTKTKAKNITKDIEYVTTNRNGDIFKIFAKNGRTNLENGNTLDLENVNGEILAVGKVKINISSDNAIYNYSNQESKFYNNVNVDYYDKFISCDNLNLSVVENIAIASGNVIIKTKDSQLKAQTVKMNIKTKDIIINSEDKIKVIKN